MHSGLILGVILISFFPFCYNSSTLNIPAVWASLGYVFSQWVASRRDRGSGLGVRALRMSVVCRSLKIKLCVSGLAPKCVAKHSRFVLWHFWRLWSNPTNSRPSSSQSAGLMVKTIVMEECEKWKSVSFESMVHHTWQRITNNGRSQITADHKRRITKGGPQTAVFLSRWHTLPYA